MKLQKCANGHFFDGEKYSECPHCGRLDPIRSNTAAGDSRSSGTRNGRGGLNSIGRSISKGSSRHGHTGDGMSRPPVDWTKDEEQTVLLDEEQTVLLMDEDQTVLLEEPETEEKQPEIVLISDATAQSAENHTSETKSDTQPEGHDDSLRYAVSQARGGAGTEETKTMAFYDFNETEPVVGWLVCIKGEYKGEGFPIKTGRNAVGRSMSMDIAMVRELSMSRDKHAVITYEPKKRKFYIQPGDGNGLTYVNDDLLLMPAQINDFDKIQMGNSDFILRSLCGEHFSWDEVD